MNFEHCTEESTNKIVSVSENRMTFVVLNDDRNRIRKVQVDGCLIDDERERCDYLFEIYDPSSLVIYLELKGHKIDNAANQLEATLSYCQKVHHGLKRCCYIVASRVPKTGPKVQVLKKKFFQKHKVHLIVKTRVAKVSLPLTEVCMSGGGGP